MAWFGVIGVTMAQEFESCERKWWFAHPSGLPAGRGAAWEGQLFGTVLHGVIERWLKADQGGRGPDGKPVDLYPPGWQWCSEKRERVTIEQEGTIKRVVTKAIQEGVLERIPDRKVEQKWYALVAPEPSAFGDVPPLVVGGTVDFMAPGVLQDHKGIKDRRYMKSKNPDSDEYLGKNLQGLVYLRAIESQLGVRKSYTFRHNYFNRVTEEVKTRTVTVTPAEVQAGVDRFYTLARRMHKLAQIPRGDGSVKGKGNYLQVPAAIDGNGDGPSACDKYGGCPYLGICRGKVSTADYARKRLRERLPLEAGKDFDVANKKNPFADDNDDEGEDEAPPAKKAKKAPVEDDSDEEEAPPKKAKKPAVTEDDDEDEAPAPKKAKKPPVEEDEDSEEEAPAPKKKAKAPVEDDEDEAPAPKAKAKPSADEKKVKLPILDMLGVAAKSFQSKSAAQMAERLLQVKCLVDGLDMDDLKAAAAAKEES